MTSNETLSHENTLVGLEPGAQRVENSGNLIPPLVEIQSKMGEIQVKIDKLQVLLDTIKGNPKYQEICEKITQKLEQLSKQSISEMQEGIDDLIASLSQLPIT